MIVADIHEICIRRKLTENEWISKYREKSILTPWRFLIFDFNISACFSQLQCITYSIAQEKLEFLWYLHVAIFWHLKSIPYFEIVIKCSDIDPGHSTVMVFHNVSHRTSISCKIKKLLRRIDAGDRVGDIQRSNSYRDEIDKAWVYIFFDAENHEE